MKVPINIVRFGLLFGVLLSVPVYQAAGAQFWGDNVGIISGTVENGDSERGLTVRSSPSVSGRPLAYLAVGTKVQGTNQFSNGYVKLRTPHQGGWVRMDRLNPVGAGATVASVDKPDLCLRIRSAPSTSADKVGCAELGQKLALTGLWSANNWAQVDSPAAGWVSASQINSDLWPGSAATSGGAKEEVYYPERPRKRVIHERNYYPWHRGYGPWGGGVNLHFKGKDKH